MTTELQNTFANQERHESKHRECVVLACRRLVWSSGPAGHEARELMRTYKRTGHVHQHLCIEAGRMMNASARMMESFQHGMLTIAKVRSGGQQTVVVQHVNVGRWRRAVKLTRFRGHRTVCVQGVRDGQNKIALRS